MSYVIELQHVSGMLVNSCPPVRKSQNLVIEPCQILQSVLGYS
jgi:hypothetical protein